MNCECIWILWELYWQSRKFTNRSALFFNLHQESRVDWLVSPAKEKDWTLKTMNLTVPGLCTYPNIFMARNKLNHVSGRDSLWYMTSNLCDLVMDKDPITQYKTNFFECLFLLEMKEILFLWKRSLGLLVATPLNRRRVGPEVLPCFEVPRQKGDSPRDGHVKQGRAEGFSLLGCKSLP
jgi:hypothetical protein